MSLRVCWKEIGITEFFSRILALEKLGAVFNQVSTPLKYTPRKFAIDPASNSLIVIETDHNALTETAKQDRKQKIAEVKCLIFLISFSSFG